MDTNGHGIAPTRERGSAVPAVENGAAATGPNDAPASSAMPLAVDLDGTLVNTDTLVECLVGCLKDWRALIRIPGWLFRGKAHLKARLAERAALDAGLLPYNAPLLDHLRKEKAAGRRLVLVTAANDKIAHAVNAHLGLLFDEVIASNETVNLRAKRKAQALAERFGAGFVYAGNERADLDVWAEARSAVLVNAPSAVARRAAALAPIERSFPPTGRWLPAALRAIRVHQWVKNLLVFVPILTANAYGDGGAWAAAASTFLAFCLTASGIYVINDLFDISADRRHATKRNRPFASGALPLAAAFGLVPILLACGALAAVSQGVAVHVLAYAAISIAYSMKLKEKPLVDVFVLAALYTVRLYAGAAATGYHASAWLLAFSGFAFLSLAMVKRVSELGRRQASDGRGGNRRGYDAGDLNVLTVMGIGAGFTASLVLALYVQSDAALKLYANPHALLATVPLMLFWQCRLWLATARGYMVDDPIVYSAKDWVTHLVGVALLATVLTAEFWT